MSQMGSYLTSDKTSKPDNVVIIDQETAVSVSSHFPISDSCAHRQVDQGHHWNMSRREKVMDVEQGSANSSRTTEIDHHSQNTHPFARWDSNVSLTETPYVRGGGGRAL
jgi:hypothetical protein